MQEKLKAASYSEQIQMFTLVPIIRLKCNVKNILMSLNTLFKSHENKNIGGILVKPAPKKWKTIITERFYIVTNVY